MFIRRAGVVFHPEEFEQRFQSCELGACRGAVGTEPVRVDRYHR